MLIKEIVNEVSKIKPEIFPFYFEFTYEGFNYLSVDYFIAISYTDNVALHIMGRPVYAPPDAGIICIEESDEITWFEHPSTAVDDKSVIYKLIDPMLGMYVDIKEKHNNDFKQRFDHLVKYP